MGTFVIMAKVCNDPARAIATLKFFSWGFMQGDHYVNSLDFVHLPDAIQAKVYRQMMTITDRTGKPLTWSPL